MANQFFRNQKREEEEKKQEFEKKVDAFLADLRELENKHHMMLKPIITQDGPRIIPQEIPELPKMPKELSEKSYVKTTEPSPVGEVAEVPEN